VNGEWRSRNHKQLGTVNGRYRSRPQSNLGPQKNQISLYEDPCLAYYQPPRELVESVVVLACSQNVSTSTSTTDRGLRCKPVNFAGIVYIALARDRRPKIALIRCKRKDHSYWNIKQAIRTMHGNVHSSSQRIPSALNFQHLRNHQTCMSVSETHQNRSEGFKMVFPWLQH
jgi:hypothetical protein